MPLYKIQTDQNVSQIKSVSFNSERELQKLFEKNLHQLLGVHYVASEFTTGDRQRGRIDTLGVDQNGSPTIIEYKKASKENVINQGLFYLDWLVDHKGDFTIAARYALGADVLIDWSNPRLILIAESFSDYDKYAVNRIEANIDLWTFRCYGEDLLYLDPIYESKVHPRDKAIGILEKEDLKAEKSIETPIYSIDDHLQKKSQATTDLLWQLRDRIFELAEEGEIIEKANKMYIGYKHGKNFCEVRLQSKALQIWVDISYNELNDPFHLGRDMADLGHYGTGQVEIKLTDHEDLDKVVQLIEQSYKQTV